MLVVLPDPHPTFVYELSFLAHDADLHGFSPCSVSFGPSVSALTEDNKEKAQCVYPAPLEVVSLRLCSRLIYLAPLKAGFLMGLSLHYSLGPQSSENLFVTQTHDSL